MYGRSLKDAGASRLEFTLKSFVGYVPDVRKLISNNPYYKGIKNIRLSGNIDRQCRKMRNSYNLLDS